MNDFELFDAHFHIIDERFPLIPNANYLPDIFTCDDYLQRTRHYKLCGGAVVSGSFQAFDQCYLIDALKTLGPSFVGVTQLPSSVTDNEIIHLHNEGVRGLRFNLKRGGSEGVRHLSFMADRVYDMVGWHVELYVDAKDLVELYETLMQLPLVSIDHLGLTQSGFKTLVKLIEKGVRVKATGFSRTDFNVSRVIKDLYAANPKALMFGTDLPSTRAPKAYTDDDFILVAEALGVEHARNVFSNNAIEFYKCAK